MLEVWRYILIKAADLDIRIWKNVSRLNTILAKEIVGSFYYFKVLLYT